MKNIKKKITDNLILIINFQKDIKNKEINIFKQKKYFELLNN